MTELKTLINIEHDNWNTRDSGDNVIAVFVKPLRQEAIKWIKELRDNNVKYNNKYFDFQDSGHGVYTNNRYGAIINWIKHFFNIEESELK